MEIDQESLPHIVDQTNRGNNGVTITIDNSPFINSWHALLKDHPPLPPSKNESVFESDEKFNDYVEELVATKGNAKMQQTNDTNVSYSSVTEVGSKVNDFVEKKLAETNSNPAITNEELDAIGDETYALRGFNEQPDAVGGKSTDPAFLPNHFDASEMLTKQPLTHYGKSEMSHELTIDADAEVNSIQVEIPGVEQAAEAGESKEVVKVGIIGNSSATLSHLTATTLIGQGVEDAESGTEEKAIAISEKDDESNSQRKRRLAQQHNNSLNPNKILVVKLRPQGLSIRLEVLRMSNREINLNKERGIFAVYTVNSAVAASTINRLPYSQYKGVTIINQITLDWLLDQIGETEAFEIRSGRLNPQTSKTKFVVTKTPEEWIAKGFHFVNGSVKI